MGKKKGDGVLQFSREDLDRISYLAGMGLPLSKIAPFFGRSLRTFQTYKEENETFRMALERGKAEAMLKVTETAFDMATSGKCPAMTMFWLERKAGWKRDEPAIEINNEVNVQNSEVEQLADVIAGLITKTREVKEIRPILLDTPKEK